jgi:hypothetical protein
MGNAPSGPTPAGEAQQQYMHHMNMVSTLHDPFPNIVFPTPPQVPEAASPATSPREPAGEAPPPLQPPRYGFRVLSALANSPGQNLVPWFDHVIGVSGSFFTPDANSFEDAVRSSTRVLLCVYNSKQRSQRFVTVIPRRDWGGPGLLGLSIGDFGYLAEDDDLRSVRILSSASASFEGEKDYILGIDDHPVSSVEDVQLPHAAKLHVYNSGRDDVRVVHVHRASPQEELGIEVGCGLIHDVPLRCRATLGRNGSNSAGSTQTQALNLRVRTPEGDGLLLERLGDGSDKVRLDWGPGPPGEGALVVVGHFRREHVQMLDDL